MLNGSVVVSHMAFDRVSLGRAHQKHALPSPDCRWLDTAKVSRRAWTQFAQRGYGLASIAAHCGIEFKHHEAVEDAYAAGRILLRAIAETSIDIDGWIHRVHKLGGKAKSARHLKAEQAIAEGQAIRILTERDFKATIGLAH